MASEPEGGGGGGGEGLYVSSFKNIIIIAIIEYDRERRHFLHAFRS